MADFETKITKMVGNEESGCKPPDEVWCEESLHSTTGNMSASLDRVLADLAHHGRRQALYCLHNYDNGEMSISALIRQVVSLQTNTDPASVPEETFEQAYRSFQETHLPKLALLGLIDYDLEENWIALSENTDIMPNEFPIFLLQLTANAEQPDEAITLHDNLKK